MLIVTNEQAGRTEQDVVTAVADELATSGPVEVATSADESDLDRILARRAGRPLIVVGGDGSLHTVLQHLWRLGEAADCPVGIVPLGTGNDFATSIGMPADPVEAARSLRSATVRPTDLLVDDAGGVVVNAVHVGVGAQAAAIAQPLKRRLRTVAFPVGAVAAGVRAKGWRLRVEVDGVLVSSGRLLMAGVSNGRTIAGGFGVLAPDASPFDGRANVTVSRALRPWAKVGYAVRLQRGTHPEHPDVLYRTGRSVTISGEPFQVNTDGELSGPIRRRTWTLQPESWHLLVPETYSH